MIKAEWTSADTLDLQPTCNQFATDCISRRAAIDVVNSHRYVYENKHLNDYEQGWNDACDYCADEWLDDLPPTQSDIAEKLYLYKCYITDKEGLQHEVIHTGDIRKVTGWEI